MCEQRGEGGGVALGLFACPGRLTAAHLHHALHSLTLRVDRARDGHLCAPAAEQQLRLEHHVPNDLHGVAQVALDLVEHILAAASDEDGARLGILAVLQEGEVLSSK